MNRGGGFLGRRARGGQGLVGRALPIPPLPIALGHLLLLVPRGLVSGPSAPLLHAALSRQRVSVVQGGRPRICRVTYLGSNLMWRIRVVRELRLAWRASLGGQPARLASLLPFCARGVVCACWGGAGGQAGGRVGGDQCALDARRDSD
jgi:hypothetical protein